eukprot:1639099-Pyramimonas_sp.AAC.1
MPGRLVLRKCVEVPFLWYAAMHMATYAVLSEGCPSSRGALSNPEPVSYTHLRAHETGAYL